MGIRIGNISISLTAETSSFNTSMEKASAVALNSSKNIERSFNMMGAAIAAATGSAIGALGILIDKTEETVFEMQKMAQQAGVSVQSFSKMAYAAKVAGMPTDQLSVIMSRIAHSSLLAAYGSQEQASAYKALGVSVTNANGTFKTADQLILDLSKSLDGYRDSAAKTGIETVVMGRSGAQAAELMHVLATRFDEISEKADRLSVVFNQNTARQAQKLHDSFIDLQEASLGLSVRLLSQVAPALDTLAQRIVSFVSDASNMQKVEAFGADLAKGLLEVGDAFEFLVNHAETVKIVLETLAGIRVAGMFLPMIASAAGASNVFAKFGIAAFNLTGKLLGVGRLGNVLAPVARGTVDYASALAGLASTEGIAATASYAFSEALVAIKGALITTVGPAALAAGSVYEFLMAVKSAHEYSELKADTGKSWWQLQRAEIEEATSSAHNFYDYMKMVIGLSSDAEEKKFYSDVNKRAGGSQFHKGPSFLHDKIDMSKLSPNADDSAGKKDLKGLETPAKPDELKKKLDELIEKAHAAQRALALVGTTPQQQRDSEILEQYNLFLADQKFQLDKLTPSKRAAAEAEAHAAIVTQVNTEALTKYRTELYNLSQSTATSIQEHLAMAAAISKSAQAMQDATVAARVNAEFMKFGPNWQSDPSKVADAQKRAGEIRAEINTANQEADNKALANVQLQIAAQQHLNAAILQGAEAKRQAAIASEQAAIRQDFADRGDTNTDAMQTQIDLVRRRSDAEKQSADLQRASNMDALQRYREQITAINDAVSAAKALNVAVDQHEVMAANKEALDSYYQQIDKVALATGSAMDGLKVALDQMARDTESNAQRMFEAVSQAIDSMNDAVAKTMMLHGPDKGRQAKEIFSSSFRGIGENMARQSLKSAESAGMKALGFGAKPDGSQSKPFYVKLVGMLDKLGYGAGNTASNVFGNLGQKISTGMPSWMTGAIKAFLPGFADGTDSMVPGMPAIVGEKGPELFVPPSAGAIVPNHQLRNAFNGGHEIHNHIDARGSADPAQTVAIIDRYMKQAAPQIVAQSIKSAHESKVRTPPRGRAS